MNGELKPIRKALLIPTRSTWVREGKATGSRRAAHRSQPGLPCQACSFPSAHRAGSWREGGAGRVRHEFPAWACRQGEHTPPLGRHRRAPTACASPRVCENVTRVLPTAVCLCANTSSVHRFGMDPSARARLLHQMVRASVCAQRGRHAFRQRLCGAALRESRSAGCRAGGVHVYACVYLSPPPAARLRDPQAQSLQQAGEGSRVAHPRQRGRCGRGWGAGGRGRAQLWASLGEIPVLWPTLALATRFSALCNHSRDVAAKRGPRSGGEELLTATPPKAKGAEAEAGCPDGGWGVNPDARPRRLRCPRLGWARLGAAPLQGWSGRQRRSPPGSCQGTGLPPRRAAPSTAQPGRAGCPPARRGLPRGRGSARSPPAPTGRGAAVPGRVGESWEVWGLPHFARR